MDTPKKPNKLIVASIVIVLLAVASAAAIVLETSQNPSMKTSDTDTSTAQTQSTDTSASGTNNATANSGNYKDGTYNAEGNYRTPGGNESIGVKITLTGGVITDASVTQNASGGEAEEYQQRFANAYKSEVVGKKIDSVSLSRVAGSSLTPIGFDNALDAIKSDAQS